MIWTHKSRLHWANCEIEGIESEVRVVNGVSHWALIDLETGEILYSGKENHPIEAMKIVIGHAKAIVEVRDSISDLEKGINNLTGAYSERTH
jgi:hypothetical protein